ncbi:GbsR/MarR family transcriptional regulator, partial [Phytoactinopolyspora endophytica]|uniref:GbsR/MarR family transcriptional regulator n=1 Tax=Phytoactinopolyspora endophytica TaxID=1642495 RepID=UPI00197BBA9F
MPGGRLSRQDRTEIDSGLAAGLGYAEIARQLGRPTSTVSREVARNGGSRGYRAEHAHLATGRRARRRKLTTPPALPGAATPHQRDPETVRGFIDQLTTVMVETGLPRMSARVLTCLFTVDSGSLTAAELVQYLQVSPASVSKAITYLEGIEVIRRERDPGSRRERYIVDDDVWLGSWSASARRTTRWAEVAREGAKLLDTATPAGGRLDQMARFFARLGEDMAGGPATIAALPDDTLT